MRSPLLVAGGIPAAPQDAAATYVRARRRNAWIAALVGTALAVAGFAGFGHYGGRSDALAKNGVRATATVMATALYGGRLGGNHFNEHIDVAFATAHARERARIWIGEQDRFRVGQPVEIVYDPSSPGRAQLAHGADIGPVGFPLFFALVLGACFAVLGVVRLRVCRDARRVLRLPPQRVAVTSTVVPRGRSTGRLVVVAPGSESTPLAFWSLTRSGWGDGERTVQAEVYGELEPGKVLVVVAPGREGVAIGRTWRGRRARRLHTRHAVALRA